MSPPNGTLQPRERGGDDVAAAEALDALARARSLARDRGERFTDLYVWAFCGVLCVVWILSFARQSFTGQVCTSDEGVGCVLQQHPTYAGLAVALVGVGVLVLAAGQVGPVSAERALARWLLSTTAERGVLLRGSLVGVVTGTALAGTAAGLLAAMAAQGGGLEPAPLGAGALVGATVGAVVPLVLVRPQAARPYGDVPGRPAGRALVVAGLGLLVWLLVAVPAGGTPQVSVPVGGVFVVGGVAVLAALLALVRAVRTGGVLAHLSDRQLARGREVVDVTRRVGCGGTARSPSSWPTCGSCAAGGARSSRSSCWCPACSSSLRGSDTAASSSPVRSPRRGWGVVPGKGCASGWAPAACVVRCESQHGASQQPSPWHLWQRA